MRSLLASLTDIFFLILFCFCSPKKINIFPLKIESIEVNFQFNYYNIVYPGSFSLTCDLIFSFMLHVPLSILSSTHSHSIYIIFNWSNSLPELNRYQLIMLLMHASNAHWNSISLFNILTWSHTIPVNIFFFFFVSFYLIRSFVYRSSSLGYFFTHHDFGLCKFIVHSLLRSHFLKVPSRNRLT